MGSVVGRARSVNFVERDNSMRKASRNSEIAGSTQRTPKVAFLARSLGFGGAERQLVTLAHGLVSRGWDITVLMLYSGGPLEADLHKAGVRVEALGKRRRYEFFRVLFRLWSWLRRARPDILHGYLTVPNIISTISGWLFPSLRIAWGVRASEIDLEAYDRFTAWTERVAALFARRADLIIANSYAGGMHCRDTGYPRDRLIVISNGVDTARFRPDPIGRSRLRKEWLVSPAECVVGLIARVDPMKGYEVFLRAISRSRDHRLRFICVGEKSGGLYDQLAAMISRLGISDRLLWLSPRYELTSLYSALDILCSSSIYGEGFSNVVAEAMACGVPCVVTNVGDSTRIVGATGEIVPPGNPDALARGWSRMHARLEADSEGVKDACRDRIISEFSLERLIDTTAEALAEVGVKARR